MRVGAGRAEAGAGQGMRAGERWLLFFFSHKEEDLHYFCIREWGLMPAEDDFSEC